MRSIIILNTRDFQQRQGTNMTKAPAALMVRAVPITWPQWYQHWSKEEGQAAHLSPSPSKELQQRTVILCGSVDPREEAEKNVECETWLRFGLKPPRRNLSFHSQIRPAEVNTEKIE